MLISFGRYEGRGRGRGRGREREREEEEREFTRIMYLFG